MCLCIDAASFLTNPNTTFQAIYKFDGVRRFVIENQSYIFGLCLYHSYDNSSRLNDAR
jgi:hypothetical protein